MDPRAKAQDAILPASSWIISRQRDDPRPNHPFRHHLFRRVLVDCLFNCEVCVVTFHDFNLKVPVATVPEHKARLIRDGITRNEYRSRFGMDEASERYFQHHEEGNKLLKSMEKAAPKPREKFTIQELILDTLIERREGLNAEEISRLLVMNKRVIQNALSILKNEGQVRGERFPNALKAGLHWFATASAMPAKEQHHGISDFYPTVIDIQKVTAVAFQSSFRAIMSESRSPSVVRARFAAIYLAEKLKKLSTTDLARRFARQDHTTVIHALKRAREFIRLEPDFAAKVDAAEAELAKGRKP
jgi:hypothetical protein